MRRRGALVAAALVAGLCANIAGAGPAWAGKGETATTLEVPSTSHYGAQVHMFGRVDDDSDSCTNLITADCNFPHGTVDLYDGDTATTPFATGTLVENHDLLGRTSTSDYAIEFSGLAPGRHEIHAVYTSTNDFDSSDSRSNPHIGQGFTDPITVSIEPTSTTLSQDFATTTTGGNVRFTVQVTPNDPPDLFHGASPPTGSVDIREVVGTTTTSFGASPIDFSGRAVITTGAIPAGTHNLTSHYNGDTNYTFSDSATLSHQVTQGSVTSSLTASATNVVFGQPVTLTNTLTPVAPATVTPTGIVNIVDVSTLVASPTVNGSGVATYSSSTLALGPHTFGGFYSGDVNYDTRQSNDVGVTVSRANTTTALTGPTSSAGGQSATFTATVSVVSPGTGTPTGNVQFKDGTTNLGAPRPVNGSRVATFTSTVLTPGSHQISAVYAGDTNFNASTSSTVTDTVTCDKVVTGSTSSVNGGPGSTCITGANVSGAINVPAGGTVLLINDTIGGTLTATGAGRVVVCGSTFGGSVTIRGDTGFALLGDPADDGCAGNTFQSGVTLSNNTGGLALVANRISGAVSITGNTGSGPAPAHTNPIVSANTIGGSLNCSGNSPVMTNPGTPNSAVGKKYGECAAL